MYRKDVPERIDYMIKKEEAADLEPNFAEVGRQMGCDYRTAKSAYEKVMNGEAKDGSPRPKAPSKLDPYKDQIREKLEIPCTVSSIFRFTRKKGYTGGQTILKKFCNKS